MSTDYEYDPDLPYVVVGVVTGMLSARFRSGVDAEEYALGHDYLEVIDTTPKPRVPDDAEWIFWWSPTGRRRFARYWGGVSRKWMDIWTQRASALEDLPGVTPDTVFTVLDERKS